MPNRENKKVCVCVCVKGECVCVWGGGGIKNGNKTLACCVDPLFQKLLYNIIVMHFM